MSAIRRKSHGSRATRKEVIAMVNKIGESAGDIWAALVEEASSRRRPSCRKTCFTWE